VAANCGAACMGDGAGNTPLVARYRHVCTTEFSHIGIWSIATQMCSDSICCGSVLRLDKCAQTRYIVGNVPRLDIL